MEFVKLTSAEKTYTEKSLLEVQAQFISVLQHLSNYHNQRDEELKLKLALRNKIEESKEFLESLDKSLPKSHFKDNIEKIKISEVKSPSSPMYESLLPTKIIQEETKEQKLQRELAEIKRKLSRL
jgi:hypothetical protein